MEKKKTEKKKKTKKKEEKIVLDDMEKVRIETIPAGQKFKAHKGKIYEHVKTVTDQKGNEEQITSYDMKISDQEPDFFKLYIKSLMLINDVKVPYKAVEAMLSQVNGTGYTNDDMSTVMFFSNPTTREAMADYLGVKTAQVYRYIKAMADEGIIVQKYYANGKAERGSYYLNPYYIAKGNWRNIQGIRAQFSLYIENVDDQNNKTYKWVNAGDFVNAGKTKIIVENTGNNDNDNGNNEDDNQSMAMNDFANPATANAPSETELQKTLERSVVCNEKETDSD